MFGPSAKYRGAPVDADAVPLHWGARTGYPLRFPPGDYPGGRPLLTPDELDRAETVLTPGYGCYTLPAQSADYLAVQDKIMNGLYLSVREQVVPDKDDPKVVHCHVWWAALESKIPPAGWGP